MTQLLLALAILAQDDDTMLIGRPTVNAEAPSYKILVFTATWCGPCRENKPEIDKLKTAGYPIKIVDVDRNRDLVEKHQIKSLPTFVVLRPDGTEGNRKVGTADSYTIGTMYNEVVNEDQPRVGWWKVKKADNWPTNWVWGTKLRGKVDWEPQAQEAKWNEMGQTLNPKRQETIVTQPQAYVQTTPVNTTPFYPSWSYGQAFCPPGRS